MLIYRLHVFADLLPYICTFPDCNDELRQFPSRNAWAEHEWEKHRSCPVWACPECPVECCTSANWIEHVRKVHGRTLASSHGTSAADAAARRRPQIINDEKCHLCDKALGTSQKDIRGHVGKHLEEVALMALPKEDEEDFNDYSISDHEASYPHGPLVGEAPGSAGNLSGRCPFRDCGRHCKDLKAHMLTHMSERRFKCSVVSCEYREKGFARKYDRNRHILTHYTGTMVCGFCLGFGTAEEKSFNRADVFKRHLTSVHGVELTSSNNPKRSLPTRVRKRLSHSSLDAVGFCSMCSENFASAQEFYEHLDDCVLRVVQREEAREATNEHHPPEVAKDLAVQETLDRQVPPSAKCDGQDQSSFGRMRKTRMNLNQIGNPTVQKRRPSNECTTNELGPDSRIPSMSDLLSLSDSLQPKITKPEPNSRNTKTSDVNQHSMFQTDSLPVTQKYSLYVTFGDGLVPFPASYGSVQLNDCLAYQTIEKLAEASIQEHCHSFLQGESWQFRNGNCSIHRHHSISQRYDLNSVEDWKFVCTSLESWLTANGHLHQHLEISRNYSPLMYIDRLTASGRVGS